MLYIRKKDNPLLIKSWGNVEPGGLGEFDTELYEEVLADNLPDGWQTESPPKSLDVLLQELYRSLPIALRALSAGDIKIAQTMLQLGDLEGAKEYLESSDLDTSIKTMCLALFTIED